MSGSLPTRRPGTHGSTDPIPRRCFVRRPAALSRAPPVPRLCPAPAAYRYSPLKRPPPVPLTSTSNTAGARRERPPEAWIWRLPYSPDKTLPDHLGLAQLPQHRLIIAEQRREHLVG